MLIRQARLCMVALLATAVAVPMFAQSGESTFKSRCAMCHGADGTASSPMAKSMKIPSVKSPDFKKLSESEMVADTTNGKAKMPAYKGKLSDAQIKEVVAYMRSLEK
ncbi:MAG TPA: cytochrome c [Acidobacteriaceae bacterium]|jgi:mono/diheme cytochrome c family protein|nr:cytochrome c [Acidobacteriaceae bacterium]